MYLSQFSQLHSQFILHHLDASSQVHVFYTTHQLSELLDLTFFNLSGIFLCRKGTVWQLGLPKRFQKSRVWSLQQCKRFSGGKKKKKGKKVTAQNISCGRPSLTLKRLCYLI